MPVVNKTSAEPKGKKRLQLKGRIFMQNVTDLTSAHRPGMLPHESHLLLNPNLRAQVIRC